MKRNKRVKMVLSRVLILVVLATMTLGSTSFAARDNLWSSPPKLYAFTDSEDLAAKIIGDPDFIKSHASIADMLGFGWCGGTGSRYVGEDFEFRKIGDGRYSLKARYNSNDPHASGYWADKRLEMVIENVEFYVDGDTMKFGTHKMKGLTPQKVFDDYVVNSSGSTITEHPELSYTTNTSWSRADTFNFGQSIGIKNKYKFDIGIMGNETEIEVKLDFSQGWTETNGTSESIRVNKRFDIPLDPYSKRHVKMVLSTNEVDLPYSCNVYMDYDITYKGFLRWGGNAHVTHPTNRPYVEKTFGRGQMSAAEEMYDQYIHRDINGYSEWDWNSIDDYRLQYYMSNVVKTQWGGVQSGKFSCIPGAVVKSEIGPCVPLDGSESIDTYSGSRVRRSTGLPNVWDINLIMQ